MVLFVEMNTKVLFGVSNSGQPLHWHSQPIPGRADIIKNSHAQTPIDCNGFPKFCYRNKSRITDKGSLFDTWYFMGGKFRRVICIKRSKPVFDLSFITQNKAIAALQNFLGNRCIVFLNLFQ